MNSNDTTDSKSVHILLPINVMEDERGMPITYTSDGKVKNYHYDIEWNFSSTEAGNVDNTHIVSFTDTNLKYRKGIQDTLFQLYFIIKQRDKIAPTTSQLKSWRMGLQHVCELLDHTNWSVLNEDREYQRFTRRLKKRKLGKKTIENNVVVSLNKLREGKFVTQNIVGKDLIALGVGKPTNQAIAIPVYMYQKLLGKSIAIVEKYYEYRHDISAVMKQAYDLKEQMKNDGRSRKMLANHYKKIIHHIPDFNVKLDGTQLLTIQVACLIVVLAFSGARIGEAVSFNKDSYKDEPGSNGNTIATLSGFTSKGNGGKPKLVTWQTHPIAKFALELAVDMTASTRTLYFNKIKEKMKSGEYDDAVSEKKIRQVKSAFIVVDVSHQKDTYVTKNMNRNILSQASKWGIKASPEDVEEFDLLNPFRKGSLKVDEFLPKLSPHDFRRTFAVFFKRYNFGTAAGIQFQFKHKNINMSKYYTNNAELMHMRDVLLDKELLNELEEAGISLGIDVYDEIYNKSENLSGHCGEEIAKEKRLNKLNGGGDVYMTRSEIEEHVRSGDFSIVLLPTGGYCTNPECNRICGQAIFNAEKKRCIHTVYTDKSAKILAKQRKRLIVQFRGLNTGDKLKNSILAGLKQKIQNSEITLKKHKISFEPFQDLIGGVA